MIDASQVEGTELEGFADDVADLLLREDIRSVGLDIDAIRVVLLACRRLGLLIGARR
jgi:hypothetical protein